MQKKTALVVDDSRVARMTLAKRLKTHGFDVAEMASGEDVLDWLKQTDNHADAIFMDVMMDGIDGLTATREIKATQAWSDIPVIICTGHDAPNVIDNAWAVGADAVLSKPPTADKVAAILSKIQAATTLETESTSDE